MKIWRLARSLRVYPFDALGGYLCRYPPCVDTGMWLLTNVRKTDNKNLLIYRQLIRFFGAARCLADEKKRSTHESTSY